MTCALSLLHVCLMFASSCKRSISHLAMHGAMQFTNSEQNV